MVTPCRKDQQGFGHGVHRIIEHQGPQLFSKRRATRFACQRDRPALRLESLRQAVDMGRFAGAVNAFKTDEKSTCHACYCPRWYLFTARLCASRLSLNWLLPSPRATKYSARLLAGCATAMSEALPGMAMGVGGKPARV